MQNIKALDLAYARLQAPDLDRAEEFLLDFGLVRTERTPTALYMRGTDSAPLLEVVHLGEPRYLGSAWDVASEDELTAAAARPGASGVEPIDEPGGGKRVRLTDPLGYTVELVHGRQASHRIPVTPTALNFGWDGLARKKVQRFPRRPSQIKRIAHVVLTTPRVMDTVRWYRDALGLVRLRQPDAPQR